MFKKMFSLWLFLRIQTGFIMMKFELNIWKKYVHIVQTWFISFNSNLFVYCVTALF